ncbi:transcription factor S [Halobaculum gomorrense]|uniref:Transcription factor S n=1 Tax=Halobaculum gomorrense TaxID=43928 RepID=A0A1M5R6D3_9EURY|nr:transcription factor S [Halobaculum gomorrense]SHH21393.1 DNA-directed RNA polymerase, subunit M [Halobaculum gomorrense]
MNFCDECGSMMKADDDTWVCGSCGHEELRDEATEAGMTTTQGQEGSAVVDVSEMDQSEIGPTVEQKCPECDEVQTVRYEMKQIRSADESETRFFTCTECGQKWREDDH